MTATVKITERERNALWEAAIRAGNSNGGPAQATELIAELERILTARGALADDRGLALLDGIIEIAQHWHNPSGDFRYDLRELAQVLRELIHRTVKIDVFDNPDWKPRGADPRSHGVVFTQTITDQNTQVVCACGHVTDSFGSTVAARFGEHLRKIAELRP